MGQIRRNFIDKTYIMKNVGEKKLGDLNYRYDKKLSGNEAEIYSRKFIVYKYHSIPEIECVISIDIETGIAGINVYNISTGSIYAPFYQNKYGKYDKVIGIIHNNIESEMNRIGLSEV